MNSWGAVWGVTLYDWIAASGFVLCWVGYHLMLRVRNNVDDAMHSMRRLWIQAMLQREVRIMDAHIHASLMGGVGFFASTSLVLLGGLLAMLGGREAAFEQVAQWSLLGPSSSQLLEAKLLTLMAIFIYAFFKFAWAYRLFSYVAICIGALPPPEAPVSQHEQASEALAASHAIAGKHFNRGIRAFYFGVAVLGWFVHPLLMLVMVVGVVIVLYRRDYHSKFGASVQRLQRVIEAPSIEATKPER